MTEASPTKAFDAALPEFVAAQRANQEAGTGGVTPEIKEIELRYSLATIALVEALECPKCGAAPGAACTGAREQKKPVLWSWRGEWRVHAGRLTLAARRLRKAGASHLNWNA
ncbi:zinc finger domain-containing protein [Catenuloplanes japonicus]|uniref:zinc finger domain-containing protein n=1 Tax=Catenuloplanes japonicus TaxID=33876 RepID=UPI000527005E|nr:hypothetical protein [Catenuloplanes japonicus]